MIVQTDLHNYFVSNHFGPALFAVYSLGTLQLPLMGLIWEATNSVLITRVSVLEKRDERREIVLLLARAARKLAAVYFPVYVFLMVVGREFIRVLFTARFADSWPIFAVNLTLLPFGIVLLDPLYRAFERERYFLLRFRLVLAAVLIAGSLVVYGARRLAGRDRDGSRNRRIRAGRDGHSLWTAAGRHRPRFDFAARYRHAGRCGTGCWIGRRLAPPVAAAGWRVDRAGELRRSFRRSSIWPSSI